MSTAIYSHPDCLRHEMGSWHPESPSRLQAIDDQLILARLDGLIEQRSAPLADTADILRNHTPGALALVRDHVPATPGDYYPLDGDTSLCHYSYQAALRAAGAAVAATDAVIAGSIANAFCAVRPPGHHATPTEPMGFCLFNNVAIAARHAMEVHGLERVAIVDFDVHHGNGTADAFRNEPRVLMVSFFQHPFYPYSDPEPITASQVNVPVPARADGETVRKLVQEQWLPALHAHQPQMIFISAGFDAHRDDDMGGMGLVEADYAWITRQVMAVAKQYARGRIVSCLEGGYELSALGRSVVAHLKVLAELE
ncbi:MULTISPECIES: histone deacetylase family protein [unclassified Massilia]|uniref:histone deacetylase family protein n=1 Tax=unclassified Massilia TaxID=2609279 RepID=UPI001B82D987|nr:MULTISPECIES: histone deacetylase family protein [unclassified Massilia]MBQ5938649.1 histone deacetylase family protein [Massilia sp. AB1]MBQ5964639.1 histone deacetylase family protein [Massilia sp. ZL223]